MPDFFIKNESSVSLNDGSFGDFLGGGVKYSAKSGNYEGMLAFKTNETSKGGFGEFKYTTPKYNDFAFESRTRIQLESAGNSMTNRVALKYSKDLGRNFSVYEIAGATAKISFNKNGSETVTPTSLSGLGYNITPKLNCYAEVDVSRSYNINQNQWGKVSSNAYLGVKYTF